MAKGKAQFCIDVMPFVIRAAMAEGRSHAEHNFSHIRYRSCLSVFCRPISRYSAHGAISFLAGRSAKRCVCIG